MEMTVIGDVGPSRLHDTGFRACKNTSCCSVVVLVVKQIEKRGKQKKEKKGSGEQRKGQHAFSLRHLR